MKHLLFLSLLTLLPVIPAKAQQEPAAPEKTSAEAPSPGEGSESVVALSMGEKITESDLEPDEQLIRLNKTSLDEEAYQDWYERARVARLTELIFVPLLGEFGRNNGITASEEEIDAFIEESESQRAEAEAQFTEQRDAILKRLERSSISPSDRKLMESQLETLNSILDSKEEMETRARERFGEDYESRMRAIDESNARQIIVAWKMNKRLFDQFGGRVVFQDDGPEPLEAYADFLAEKKQEGAFGIYDPELKAAFWDYFQNDNLHNFYTAEESHEIMKQPWWKRRPPSDDQ